jgi:hypothetical protein
MDMGGAALSAFGRLQSFKERHESPPFQKAPHVADISWYTMEAAPVRVD